MSLNDKIQAYMMTRVTRKRKREEVDHSPTGACKGNTDNFYQSIFKVCYMLAAVNLLHNLQKNKILKNLNPEVLDFFDIWSNMEQYDKLSTDGACPIVQSERLRNHIQDFTDDSPLLPSYDIEVWGPYGIGPHEQVLEDFDPNPAFLSKKLGTGFVKNTNTLQNNLYFDHPFVEKIKEGFSFYFGHKVLMTPDYGGGGSFQLLDALLSYGYDVGDTGYKVVDTIEIVQDPYSKALRSDISNWFPKQKTLELEPINHRTVYVCTMFRVLNFLEFYAKPSIDKDIPFKLIGGLIYVPRHVVSFIRCSDGLYFFDSNRRESVDLNDVRMILSHYGGPLGNSKLLFVRQ